LGERNFNSCRGIRASIINLTQKISEEIVGSYTNTSDRSNVEIRTYKDANGYSTSLSLALSDQFTGDLVSDGGEEEDTYGFGSGDIVMPGKDGWAHPLPIGERGKVLSLSYEGFGTYRNLWTVQELKYFEEFKLWCVKLKEGEGWYPAMKFQPATEHYLGKT
jgi:hypothetical protein